MKFEYYAIKGYKLHNFETQNILIRLLNVYYAIKDMKSIKF